MKIMWIKQYYHFRPSIERIQYIRFISDLLDQNKFSFFQKSFNYIEDELNKKLKLS